MRFSVLSSGSKANCTVVDTGTSVILIDCGLSARQAELRLAQVGINPLRLSAIVITHEHSDHVLGVPTLSKRYKIPVFANKLTALQIPKCYHKENFTNGADFWVGSTRITPFSITHDAVDPVGFCLHEKGLKLGLAMDLGRVTLLVSEHLKDCNYLVLESNYDQNLLKNCDYPWELKQRIASSYGHLSNDDSASLLKELIHSDLQHVVLGHLSENSNTPANAIQCHLDVLEKETPNELSFTLQCGSIDKVTDFIGEKIKNVA